MDFVANLMLAGSNPVAAATAPGKAAAPVASAFAALLGALAEPASAAQAATMEVAGNPAEARSAAKNPTAAAGKGARATGRAPKLASPPKQWAGDSQITLPLIPMPASLLPAPVPAQEHESGGDIGTKAAGATEQLTSSAVRTASLLAASLAITLAEGKKEEIPQAGAARRGPVAEVEAALPVAQQAVNREAKPTTPLIGPESAGKTQKGASQVAPAIDQNPSNQEALSNQTLPAAQTQTLERSAVSVAMQNAIASATKAAASQAPGNPAESKLPPPISAASAHSLPNSAKSSGTNSTQAASHAAASARETGGNSVPPTDNSQPGDAQDAPPHDRKNKGPEPAAARSAEAAPATQVPAKDISPNAASAPVARTVPTQMQAAVQPREILDGKEAVAPLPVGARASAIPEAQALSSPGLVNSASLVEKLGKSEVRVGVNMGDLGNVEIRTQIDRQQLRAEISADHHELTRAMTAELPALQQQLHDRDLAVSTLAILQQSAGGSGGSQNQNPKTQIIPFAPAAEAPAKSPDTLSADVVDASRALDIRI